MRLAAAVGLVLCMHFACAANIYVTTITSSDVQIIVDGKSLYTLHPGETTPEGVRLLDIRGSSAVFESGGRSFALSIGQSTTVEAVLRANAAGHFIVTAYLNGVGLPAMIDTGATLVAINKEHAQRMGIDYRRGQRTTTSTANGTSTAYLITLARVQVGEVVLANVPAAVVEGELALVLIGMSFLKHVEMRRSGDTMSLSRPHLYSTLLPE